MWQAIAANRRRSRLIVFVMGLVLIALGASLGTLIGPTLVGLGYAPPGEETLAGALAGGVAALVVWLVVSLLAVYGGDRLVLRSAHALPIEKRELGIYFTQVATISCGWRHPLFSTPPAMHLYGTGSTATACCAKR